MSFAETAPELQASRDTGREQVEQAKEQTQTELESLKQDIVWGAIPPTAQAYLSAQSKPANLTLAIAEAQALLVEDPTALDDPDLAPMLLDKCIKDAETAAKRDGLETERATGQQLDTTNEGLSKESAALQERIAGNLTGEDKAGQLADLIQQVKTVPDFPKEEREAALKQLGMIAATLNQMTALVSDPEEAKAFNLIIANSSLDLSGTTNVAVFSDVMAQVSSSSGISEKTKAKIQLEVFGVQPIKNATDMLDTLQQVRANDGKFLNADGQLVDFNEKNGVPVGRFMVYPDPNDAQDFVAKATVGGRTLSFPFSPNENPSDLQREMKAAMIGEILVQRDLQGVTREIFGSSGLAAQGYSRIDLKPEEVARAERLYGAFMGLGTIVSSEFPTEENLNSFKWRLQATHIDGDAKTNDNTGRGDLSWQKIGMLDKTGKLDMQRVTEVGAFMNTKSAALPKFEELVEKFGDGEDMPLQEENAPYDPMADFKKISKLVNNTYQAGQ